MSELTHDNVDDAFHEIQLSGKQLVFLFMATTVVSVVIFLCGVLVGRQVRAEGIAESAAASAPVPAPLPDAPAAQPVAADPPAPASDSALTYADRLQSDKAPAEDLKPRAEEPRSRPEPPKAEPEVATPPPPPAATPPAAAAATQGARPGTWAVQVVSLRDRAAASRIVQQLGGKGYPAFLVTPAPGTPAIFKVQVGRFGDREEAQRISDRLKKEEQFDPWIIR